jgi:hypothetical protein
LAIFHGALEIWRKLLEPSKKKIDFLKSLSRLTIVKNMHLLLFQPPNAYWEFEGTHAQLSLHGKE